MNSDTLIGEFKTVSALFDNVQCQIELQLHPSDLDTPALPLAQTLVYVGYSDQSNKPSAALRLLVDGITAHKQDIVRSVDDVTQEQPIHSDFYRTTFGDLYFLVVSTGVGENKGEKYYFIGDAEHADEIFALHHARTQSQSEVDSF